MESSARGVQRTVWERGIKGSQTGRTGIEVRRREPYLVEKSSRDKVKGQISPDTVFTTAEVHTARSIGDGGAGEIRVACRVPGYRSSRESNKS
eukprot:483756-Pleurochrysis_carterae.AAC.3